MCPYKRKSVCVNGGWDYPRPVSAAHWTDGVSLVSISEWLVPSKAGRWRNIIFVDSSISAVPMLDAETPKRSATVVGSWAYKHFYLLWEAKHMF